MQGIEITPTDVIFIWTMLACILGGLVGKGREIFYLMKKRISINLKLEYNGCIVDFLDRARDLQESFDIIQTMPMKPDSIVWRTLLWVYSFHEKVELAEKVVEFLFKLEPWNRSNYVVLSNINAGAGKWNGVAKLISKPRKGLSIIKVAGFSFTEKVMRFINSF